MKRHNFQPSSFKYRQRAPSINFNFLIKSSKCTEAVARRGKINAVAETTTAFKIGYKGCSYEIFSENRDVYN